ncbi:MAG: hydrogenase 2 operon protein HybA [Candidatus Thiodiazotropha sp. (ex Dulcina madagascariensis)]|nr:hydrogenase 2 operon protein HybA [Candidatus Thiodiazotropha sp. (ex Dulcina madagascariensis)]MCU7928838.1 hydrogenase 2 operon protein HybA [Candidatus Thiodiazotropha sp. (ex Dulcina madagascariensis)]
MKRRDFLKASLGGTAALLGSGAAEARGNLEPAEDAIGMLFDATLCIGCKACVSKCKEVNGMPPVAMGDQTQYDAARDLSPQTLNVIKVYTEGEGLHKDQTVDGFAFEKRSCMHCVDPGCVSVCPVTALRRHPKTGIVTYDADACIGCRTCMVGCPYNVPQFDYRNPFGEIHKCQMCNQAGVERVDKGMITGCAEVCPTGATLFGSRKALLEEARQRMTLTAGELYNYPRGDVRNPDSHHEKAAPSYQQRIWGEKEAGGTNVMHISAIAFDKLGMPPLGERSYASISETVQHTLYKYLALPAVALAGLTFVVRRNTRDDEGGDS